MEEWEEREEDVEPELTEDGSHPVLLLAAIAIALVVLGVMAVIVWNIRKERQPGEAPELVVETETESGTESGAETSDGGGLPQSASEGAEPARTEAEENETGEPVTADTGGEAAAVMAFEERNEAVTPKVAVNLRTVPSTASDESIVVKVQNGEKLTRTGINRDQGWSRVDYKGLTLYAVSQYLVADERQTDAQAQGSGEAGGSGASQTQTTQTQTTQTSASGSGAVVTQDGRSMTFTPCDDIVSPKMEVNLRGEPSTSLGNDSIHYRLKYGEQVHRTGYNEDTGWSRVEYEGEVLYAVTSYLFVVEE